MSETTDATSTVDQICQLAEHLNYPGDHCLDLRPVGDIDVEWYGALRAAELVGSSANSGTIDIRDGDPCAYRDEPPSRRLAHAVASASDQHHAIIEVTHQTPARIRGSR